MPRPLITYSRCFILSLVSASAVFACWLPFSATQAFPVFPAGFVHETVIDEGLDLPTAMAFGPGGTIFIAEKRGVVRVWQNGALLPEPFVDLSDEVNQSGDRGLIGLALHPNFPATPFVYLLYVYDPPGAPLDGEGARVARLLRVTADAANPLMASADSRVVLLGKNSTLANSGNLANPDDQTNVACQNANGYVQDCLPDDFPAHTIGTVAFGPDGKLYVGNGDGSSWKNVDPRALRVQSLNSLAGKLLRLDPLTGAGLPDNPFYDGNANSNASKVFNYGLRSPFRFTFHPVTGEPFIGDVGWGTWEEINVGRGKNFGWPCYEGGDGANEQQALFADNPLTSEPCQQLYAANTAQPSLYGYGRDLFGASLTMGVFYTGTAWPAAYRGALFFADYNNNWIKFLTFDAQGRPLVNAFSSDEHPISGVVQMLVGPDGQLYYIGLGEVSGVYRVRYTGSANQPPVAKASADVLQGVPPLVVNFSSVGSLDPEAQPLSFAWTFGDGTVSTEANPRKTFYKSGNYLVRLTVSDPEGLTHSDALEIVVGNSRPTLTLQTPVADTLYATGDVIRFSATANDAEEGDLSSRIQWKALLRHNEHTHFDFLNFTGAAGAFAIPDHGDNTAFELCANVMDSQGASSLTMCRELRPRTVTLQFNSVPSGAAINYEGVTRATPFTVTTIANSQRELTAPASFNGLNFLRWSDGGARSHRIQTGSASQTLTVFYDNSRPALTLQTPVADTLYATGDVIRFSATADDAEEGDLSSRIQWKALLHHNEHTHFDFLNFTGAAGAFAIPDHGDNTTFELCANVMDSQGVSSLTACRELRPQTVTYQFASVPVGVTINYEGVARVTPFTVTTIANSLRELSAPLSFNGLDFQGWSDGAARSHRVNTGAATQTLTAVYGSSVAPGLRADYFDNVDLTVRRFTRLDDNIDFDWGVNAPDSRLERDTFSARWRGQVQPLFTETYTFSTLSDDGVRLWVNGELLINHWSNHLETEDSATITLRAHERYDLQLEYYDRLGAALIKLLWASPSQAKEIIPASRLSQPVASVSAAQP